VEVRILGPVEAFASTGEPIALAGNKMRGLVAVLALEAGRTVTPQRLIDTLWGDQEISGPNIVQVLVSKLRRVLADAGEQGWITTQPAGYQLDIDRSDVDVARFESLVEQARNTAGDVAGDAAASAALLERSLALWRGIPLGGVPDTDLIAALRSRLDELRRAAVDDLTDAQLVLGEHHRLTAELEALVAEDPLRERRWGQLIRALYASGRQADAMRAFQRARAVLVEEIGAEPGPELRRLEAAVLAQDDAVLGWARVATRAPIGHGFRRRGNLRHPVGRCIGRGAAVDALGRLIERHRLITLTGPGGVGKTRLAQEFGTSLADSVSDGVWWVELAAARSERDVVGAVQRALGIEGGPVADPATGVAAIAVILAERDAVLVVDNCEHLLDATRSVVGELLGRCRNLRVVTTSRERLDVAAEHLVDVDPLAPDDAVSLFESRITGPVDGAASAEAIREICERLDRLPLALELAAARTRYFQLDEIRSRLSDRFALLHEPLGSATAHQRNLRTVADWSYELLDEPERIVFERLSVFADGAPLSAAVAVCAHPTVAPADVERLLYRLVDKSLIVADRSGHGTRYRMLQTLADYAAERLGARGEADDARRSHAMWVRDLAGTVAFGQEIDGATVAAVQDEDASIRDAIRWSLAAEPQLALEICNSLSGFWFGTMRVSAGWELLSAALAGAGDDDPALRATAQGWAAVFATMLQDLDAAARHADEAVAFERRLADPLRLGRATLMMALAAGYRHDGEWGRWIAESRGHFAAAGYPSGAGHASFAEGAVHLLAGELDAATSSLRAAIAEFGEHRDHLGLILAVSRMGELGWRAGDIDLYAEMHAELLELGRAGRSPGVITGATARLGHARLVQGDLAEAERLAREALAGSGSSFMPVVNGYVFRTAGLVNLALGHTLEGRRHLAAAIDAFSHGTGSLGLGQAALCWIDVSRSHADGGDRAAAHLAAERAVEEAEQCGEPWVREQAAAHATSLGGARSLADQSP
jgi:predicted ATPase/DNA-binding SARP family transcriptional activator